MGKTIDNTARPWYYKDNKTKAQAQKGVKMYIRQFYNKNQFIMNDGATSITTQYLANYIEWGRLFEMSTPKQPAQIGINAKMLAEILNTIKDYGDNKRVLITVDADNATHPVFIETPDDTAKIMLCTCRNK